MVRIQLHVQDVSIRALLRWMTGVRTYESTAACTSCMQACPGPHTVASNHQVRFRRSDEYVGRGLTVRLVKTEDDGAGRDVRNGTIMRLVLENLLYP